MNVSSTTTTLQALLRQLEPAATAAAAGTAAKSKNVQVRQAQAAPPAPAAVAPNGKTQFDPNSPRGTYLNIVV